MIVHIDALTFYYFNKSNICIKWIKTGSIDIKIITFATILRDLLFLRLRRLMQYVWCLFHNSTPLYIIRNTIGDTTESGNKWTISGKVFNLVLASLSSILSNKPALKSFSWCFKKQRPSRHVSRYTAILSLSCWCAEQCGV